MLLESSKFLGEGENIYKPHKMIQMHNQTVVIRLNFRADTIEYEAEGKKKSKKHSVSSNLTSNSYNMNMSGASRRSLASHKAQSNEVEVYFPAVNTTVYADFRSNSKREDEPFARSYTLSSTKERGR